MSVSLIGKAVQRGDIVVALHDLRRWTYDVHRTVDDSPFGGGPGMVMRPQPWGEAIDAIIGPAYATERVDADGPGAGGTADSGSNIAGPATDRAGIADREDRSAPTAGVAGTEGPADAIVGPADATERVDAADWGVGGGGPPGNDTGAQLIVPTPAGRLFTQAIAAELATARHLVFACGRYEGIDDRVARHASSRLPVRELSIGDYVLAGGEPAVLVMIEAICRLIPGVLGNTDSAADDSFGAGGGPMDGLIEGPAYTRPRTWRGLEVPPVLLSGDHAAIARWRRDQALARTARNRPDLAAKLPRSELSDRDREILSEAGFAVNGEDVAN